MHNPGHDKELDQLSREAAGHYHAPGTPDWEKLSQELDKVLPVEKRKRRFILWWWLLPVLLTGAAGGYWVFSTNNHADTAVQANAVKTAQTAPQANTPVNQLPEPANKLSAKKENSLPLQQEPVLTRANAHNTLIKHSVQLPPSNSPGGTSAENRSPAPAKATTAGKSSEENGHNHTAAAGDHASTTEEKITAGQADNTSGIKAKETDKQQAELAPREKNTPDAQPQDSSEPAPAAVTKSVKNTVFPPPGKGFSIGIVAGMDMSTVKFRYGNDPGFNIGVIGGYHFNQRWSVHTGLIYTRKNYKLAGADFTPPKGSWASYYNILTVEGDCRMYELPLLVRYGFTAGPRNRYFISTGLSSYFMTGENYAYYYRYMGNTATRNASYQSGNTHVLSIAHISAGFERRLTKNLSLQVEPYAKIPLTGVGMGQIKLSSFGLNFGLQFRQPAKH